MNVITTRIKAKVKNLISNLIKAEVQNSLEYMVPQLIEFLNNSKKIDSPAMTIQRILSVTESYMQV